MRKSRKDRNNPKKDKRRLMVSKYTRFTSEVQLQLLSTELKLVASTLPLAADEIKKLYALK